MSYATLIQLTQRYAERDLRHMTDSAGQALDTIKAEQALADASAEIDSYIGTRYMLPLLSVSTGLAFIATPEVLVRCCADIAVYRLQTLRPADDIKDARQRYEDVLKLLKAIANGDVKLLDAALLTGLNTNTNPTTMSAGLPQFADSNSLFARGNR